MSEPLRISKQTAKRFLLKALGFYPQLEVTTETMWRQLEAVQLDPVATIERNHHLVLMNRVQSYQIPSFSQLLEKGQAFEYWANEACIIPIEDYPLFEFVRRYRQQAFKAELEQYSSTVKLMNDLFQENGPLSSRDFTSSGKVIGGWDLDKATTKETSYVLSLLHRTGDIQVVRRDGATRFFHLTEQVIPEQLLEHASKITPSEASRRLLEKYYRAYRLFSATDARYGWQKIKAADRRRLHGEMMHEEVIVPVEIEGVARPYAVLKEDANRIMAEITAPETNSVRFLPPLDNLLWSRERLEDIFSFYYRWEIYIPKDKRQFGAYAMPILEGDQLIGRMDPLFDRKSGTLIVQRLELDSDFSLTNKRKENIQHGLTVLAKHIGAHSVQLEHSM
ncbi:DNA glycosylase AlkZ-like family protein [Alkalicoccobacillus porphyridii]|uniref:Winged helix-turn-helix domain-containing protein n=1 Tax=Alkalicoccobacillus porphyridii TaxID=2597270 RepID=A0A553ZVJ1_9BACI|nr:crosslink repair DNA glycosylase YcaQ family protein [Alkalicoccobacillus porphyridii]TSB45494.1 winged helix-turn-helix domain-containing protein [Alkalicoccobacillus porphyridii]